MEVIECHWNGSSGMEHSDLHQLSLHIDGRQIAIYFTDQQMLEYLDGRSKEEIDCRIQVLLDDLRSTPFPAAAPDTWIDPGTLARPDINVGAASRRRRTSRKTRH